MNGKASGPVDGVPCGLCKDSYLRTSCSSYIGTNLRVAGVVRTLTTCGGKQSSRSQAHNTLFHFERVRKKMSEGLVERVLKRCFFYRLHEYSWNIIYRWQHMQR
jgi:hypothetical protein